VAAITVKSSDIITSSNGSGGGTLSYFGNSRWYIIDIPSYSAINSNKAAKVAEFVSYLNSIPIIK
jgi:hypothetical protein